VKKWILIGAGVVVLALVGAGVAWYLHVQQQARDIKGSSTVEFVTSGSRATTAGGARHRLADLRVRRRAPALRPQQFARAAVPPHLDVPRAKPRRVPAR